jgi:hypothetical protein
LSDDDTEFSVKGLEQLLKALKAKPAFARVGILGAQAKSSGKGPSNATIGAYHEFGTRNLPIRSFLRMPISLYLGKRLQKSEAFDKEVLKRVIASGTIIPWLKLVAVVAEGLVLEAFDTGGFGHWKPSNFKYKHNAETLIETGQLMKSITSEVKESA